MENAINCVVLFYKVGSSIKDFSRKEKFRIIHSCYSEKKFSKLYFYLSFNINIELTTNYITDNFKINEKNLTTRCYFWIFLALKVKNSSFLNGNVINIKNAVITKDTSNTNTNLLTNIEISTFMNIIFYALSQLPSQ